MEYTAQERLIDAIFMVAGGDRETTEACLAEKGLKFNPEKLQEAEDQMHDLQRQVCENYYDVDGDQDELTETTVELIKNDAQKMLNEQLVIIE